MPIQSKRKGLEINDCNALEPDSRVLTSINSQAGGLSCRAFPVIILR